MSIPCRSAADVLFATRYDFSSCSAIYADYIGVKPSSENRKILLQIPDARLETLTISKTNEGITVSELAVAVCISLSSNNGSITFERLDPGNALYLTVKNGDISGTPLGSYDDFAIQTAIKKGKSNLPSHKGSGEKSLNVSSNNGAVNFVDESLRS